MEVRILHFSDLHGTAMRRAEELIQDLNPDWIVLTGDMLPDFARLPGEFRRLEAQREWWRTWRSSFLRDGVRTTYALGNHEIEGFADPGLRAVPSGLAGRVGFVEGIPACWGAWGYSREWEEDDLELEVDALADPVVVLSHVPPYGWLDLNARQQHIGHIPLRYFLDPSESRLKRQGGVRKGSPQPTSLVLCGHVHESFGSKRHGRTLVVNAATGYALLDLDPGTGVCEVQAMERLLEGRPDPYN